MSMKFSLIIILIVTLIVFTASSTYAVPLDRRHNNKNRNNNKNNRDNGKDDDKDNNNNDDNDICKNSKLDKGDGTQNPDGYCVETVMGEVPNENNMISTLIIKPADGSTLKENKKFRVDTISDKLITGFFT